MCTDARVFATPPGTGPAGERMRWRGRGPRPPTKPDCIESCQPSMLLDLGDRIYTCRYADSSAPQPRRCAQHRRTTDRICTKAASKGWVSGANGACNTHCHSHRQQARGCWGATGGRTGRFFKAGKEDDASDTCRGMSSVHLGLEAVTVEHKASPSSTVVS